MYCSMYYVLCAFWDVCYYLKNQKHMNNSSEIIFCIKDLILKGILKFHSKEAN